MKTYFGGLRLRFAFSPTLLRKSLRKIHQKLPNVGLNFLQKIKTSQQHLKTGSF
jgi:hypothetical protein